MSIAAARRWLVAIGAVGTVGIALEPAMLRHWTSPTQLLAWVVLAPLVAGLVCAARPTTDARRRAAAWLLGSVAALAAYGTYVHITANLDAGPLDFRYADRWASMSVWARWWAAATGAVGPAPVLAPAVYAQTAAVLWAAVLLARPGRSERGPVGAPLELVDVSEVST